MSDRFLAASPLRLARTRADAELAGKATSTEIQWLYDHPLLWLRAVQEIIREVETHLAKARTALQELRERVDHAEYLRARAAAADIKIRRTHVLNLAKRRLEEIKAILGPQPAAYVTVGDLIAALTEIAGLADEGDLAGAADMAMAQARFWRDMARTADQRRC